MNWSYGLIALGGLLGSSHCLGMCGGFALMLGMGRPSFWQNLRGQLAYSAGRLASYATLGAMAGFAGHSLAKRVPAMINVPALLCLLAGVFLIWQGLHAAGWFRHRSSATANTGCLFGSLFATLLKYPALRHAFAAGVFTGWLPCGLVYAFVSLAASSGDMLHGLLTMLAFGAGTVPLMVLTGVGGSLLSLTMRQRLWKAAAWSVVLTGCLTVGRGVAFIKPSSAPPAERCPFCSTSQSADHDAVLRPAIATRP